MMIAESNNLPIDRADHSLAGKRAEVLGRREVQALLLRGSNNGRSQGMFTPSFETCSQTEKRCFILSSHSHYCGQARLTLGKRASLVHYQGVNLLQHFQGLGI